jgi:hypothetical protein
MCLIQLQYLFALLDLPNGYSTTKMKNTDDKHLILSQKSRRMVIIPTSYSEDTGFKYWCGDRLTWQFYREFPQSLQENAGIAEHIN